jgi:hypothetical protein
MSLLKITFSVNDGKNEWKFIDKLENILSRLVMKAVFLNFETLNAKYTFYHHENLKNLKFEIHDIFESGFKIL